jgi:fructose-1-phosphate kinase PfkB-like protein
MAEGYPNTVTDVTRLDPAGRGVNISRALSELDIATEAIVMLGTDAIGKAYQALIESEPFKTHLIERPGLTRSNTIIYDSGTKQETQIIEEGVNETDDEDDIRVITDRVVEVVQPGDTVALSGVLPRNVPVNIYARLIESVKEAGAKVVLAADGISLEIGLRSSPDIIAMRQNEVESFFNYPVRTAEDVIFSARKLSERSGGSMVLVGEHDIDYGIIVNQEQSGWYAELPPLPEGNEGTTSGADDAFLAGFLAHYRNNDDLAEALRRAMAAAAFTRTKAGNTFGTVEDVRTLLESVQIESLETKV